jgi:alpha-D-ribose 1-methylphosphonate 5-triphosphate synthase subunit PhnL
MNIQTVLQVSDLAKSFTLHNQQGAHYDVFVGANFELRQGECLVLSGKSGSGKSTLLRMLYANYLATTGSIKVRQQNDWVEMVDQDLHVLLQLRKQTIGYVSQFLRVIPRIPALDVVMQPLIELGETEQSSQHKAQALLSRLNLPEHLWSLAPSTFSGGEQQRVNIARGFIVDYPIMLLDEPTASLDELNKNVVVDLINEAKQRGTAMVGIFHDQDVRDKVVDRVYEVEALKQ